MKKTVRCWSQMAKERYGTWKDRITNKEVRARTEQQRMDNIPYRDQEYFAGLDT